MDQICAIMVRLSRLLSENCEDCVCDAKICTIQTEKETHSVLVVVELLVAQLDKIYISPPR